MAHPGFVIEQYVYHFLSQWRVGLEPSLKLDAKPNGEIAVSLNLTTSLPFNHNVEVQCSTPLSRDSGRGSRRRRRVRRAAAAAESSRESHEARIPSQVESQENQCALIENQPVDLPVVAESPLTAVSDLNIPPTSNLTQESQQITDEEPALIPPQDPIAEPAVQCSMCQNDGISFSRRTEFLRHICVDHLGEEQLMAFPEFLPNDIFQQAKKLSM